MAPLAECVFGSQGVQVVTSLTALECLPAGHFAHTAMAGVVSSQEPGGHVVQAPVVLVELAQPVLTLHLVAPMPACVPGSQGVHVLKALTSLEYLPASHSTHTSTFR